MNKYVKTSIFDTYAEAQYRARQPLSWLFATLFLFNQCHRKIIVSDYVLKLKKVTPPCLHTSLITVMKE